MAKWKKSTPYGDYKDPLQNHKFDIVVTDKYGEVIRAENAHKVLVNQVRNCYGKHVGSKKLKNLLSFTTKSDNIKGLIKTFNAKSEAINNALEEQKKTKEQITDAEIVSESKN
jgi:hypothetical protein